MNATAARALCFSLPCLLAATLAAHGGSYRGPTTPGGPGPATPGPSTPDPGTRPETGGRSDIDLTRWQLWWEFNKDPYLRRLPGEGSSDGAGTPLSAEQKRDVILPELCRALEANSNRDMVSALLVAIAKIGVDHRDFQILPLLRKRLQRADQEVRETAALALGITERVEAVPDLAALFADTPAGRALVGDSEVDDRTRAFAGHALGLIARKSDDLELKTRVFEVLAGVLDDRAETSRDILVAAVDGLRLLDPQPDTSARHKRLAWRCIEVLDRFAERDLGKARQVVQAHVAPAEARLLGRGSGADRERVKRACAQLLLGSERTNHALPQSAALALGQLAESPDAHPDDEVFSAALRRAVERAVDQQVRFFAMIALGQIGGTKNQDALGSVLKGEKGPSQAWAALALGLLAHHAPPSDVQGRSASDNIGPLLLQHLDGCGNPDVRAAFAVALGLAHHLPAAPALREMVAKYQSSEELCGYACIGLALMDDQGAIPQLRDILTAARRRPLLMAQAARALARLQQRDGAELLQRMLRRKDHDTITLAAAATSLGSIGDAGSADPLLSLLRDESLPKLLRAFAAASLGMLADDDRLPWNTWIAKDLNYRAMVETLSNGSSGVLDIL